MHTADQVLQHFLASSAVPLSHLQSDAQRIELDSRRFTDVHFLHHADVPLNAETIRVVEQACGQPDGSAKISSTSSFYVACSAAAAATLASSDLALSAHPAAANHRMTNIEAAAVCTAAAHSGTSSHLIATIAADDASRDIAGAFALALAQVPALHSIDVEQQSPTVVSFVCPAALAPRLSHWLLQRSLVQQLQRRPQLQLMNANAAWIVQSNSPQKTSVWDQGLRGQGQVVHVGDTGVDWNLCFFQSPGTSQSTPPPFFKQQTSSSKPLKCVTDQGELKPSTTHKFASYITIQGGDAQDEKGGHGTHVCGSAAGGAPNGTGLSKHNGMAPAAQLSFTDVQGPDGGLSIPDDLQNRYFPCPYKSGARVSSNSWGGSFAGYSDFSASLDAFTVDHDSLSGIAFLAQPGNLRFLSTACTAHRDREERVRCCGQQRWMPCKCQKCQTQQHMRRILTSKAKKAEGEDKKAVFCEISFEFLKQVKTG